MSKDLSKMTNEELWELFPIILSDHNPLWKESYQKEQNLLIHLVGIDNIVRINHIGSTSVPNLIAKPTIDILMEIKEETNLQEFIKQMEINNYIYSPQPNNPAPHMMFMKGYTPDGFKGQVVHVHVRYSGDWNELYFRDYLLAHSEIASEYELLKLELKQKYEHNRDAYTNAKSDFIKKYTQIARIELENKYNPK